MMRSGLPVCTTDSKSGKSSLRPVRGGNAVRLVAVRFRTHILQKPPHRVELRAKAGPVSGFQVRNCLIVVLERLLRPICREDARKKASHTMSDGMKICSVACVNLRSPNNYY